MKDLMPRLIMFQRLASVFWRTDWSTKRILGLIRLLFQFLNNRKAFSDGFQYSQPPPPSFFLFQTHIIGRDIGKLLHLNRKKYGGKFRQVLVQFFNFLLPPKVFYCLAVTLIWSMKQLSFFAEGLKGRTSCCKHN